MRVSTRLRRLAPDLLDSAQRELYEAITGGPRSLGPQAFELVAADGSLNGPFNAMLYAPEVGQALQALGAAVRYGSSLSDRVREAAILIVAARWGSAFERMAHEAVGRSIGLTQEEAQRLRREEVPQSFSTAEAVAVECTIGLLDGDLSDAEFDSARGALGDRRMFELTTLVGYYSTLALQLRVFRADLPAV